MTNNKIPGKGRNKMSKKLSVLIVDDDQNIGDTLTDILNESGFNASFTTSGEEALKLIRRKEFDVILLDIRMPEMNGVETLKDVSRNSPLTSVVMITAYAEDKFVEQAKIEGALQVLSKPLDIDKIIGFLRKLKILKTIFIVDDDKTFCDSLADAIGIHSYMVTAVHDAQEIIEAVSRQKYGIILLDMKLNGMNGLDVARAIRKEGYKCAIILMSAYCREFKPVIDEALKQDVDVFIEKPFEINDILKIMNEVSRKRLQKALA
jgi:two-component system, NtrC family, response regulator HydG